ncbi:YopX family protein [Bacillus cereus]|uniref:YopX family protein n=1 Tax=Bacillus cereus TaxID=1396 RepID=UPI0015963D4F|nr:YopX family protein [Bacillus cereus]
MRYQFRVWNLMSKKMMEWGEIFDLPAWEIFPGTPEQRAFNVMQYTGLKDKDGKDIYEGDIVRISGHPFQGSINIDGIYEVGYNELMELCCGGWYLHRMRHWAEVIGNIYENPELLEASK